MTPETVAGPKILACAAGHRRAAYVFLVDGRVRDWRVSEKAARSCQDAAEQAQTWINELKPDVLVTEKFVGPSRKSARTRKIIGAFARTAAHNYLLDVSIERKRVYPNKYDEADALARLHPEVLAWLPKKRRFFDHEPRNIVLFDALALAQAVLDDPSTSLAAAMG